MLQRYDLRQLGPARCLSSTTMEKTTMQLQMFIYKREIWKFHLAQNQCRSQTKRNLNRHFSLKSPKVSQKSGQIVQNLQQKKGPKGIRRTEGIHYLHIWPPNF